MANEHKCIIVGLIAPHNKSPTNLLGFATAYGNDSKQRTIILPLFDSHDGLAARTERAKSNVKSVYSASSTEYKALTGKIY